MADCAKVLVHSRPQDPRKLYGPHTISVFEDDMAYGPNFLVHLVLMVEMAWFDKQTHMDVEFGQGPT